jgi:hypothetical protein
MKAAGALIGLPRGELRHNIRCLDYPTGHEGLSAMGYNARNDEIRDNIERMRRYREAYGCFEVSAAAIVGQNHG